MSFLTICKQGFAMAVPDAKVGFIDEAGIFSLLDAATHVGKKRALEVVAQARDCRGLGLEELAILLQAKDEEVAQALYEAALYVKDTIYGRRMVFFAPLYVSNVCANNCLYCGFRKDNKVLVRRVLDADEIAREVELLLSEGHKRVLLVAGEHPTLSGIDYIEKAVAAVYAAKAGNASIRRVNVNCAPLSVDDFKRLKATKIGTYQCFQETYHLSTYRTMHPSGPKKDYLWRLNAPGRAMEAGIDDVGVGALFGLTDYKFEVMAMLMHAQYLDRTHGIGPHTISVPRLEPALNAPAANNPPHAVTDDDMRRIVSCLRLAVPYTGIILSTRERPDFRNELMKLGVSQISAGSRTSPGGYHSARAHKPEAEQFSIGDDRTLSEVMCQLCKDDYIPSFCTACYRTGRTGEKFMGMAKHGEIHHMCGPNALLSLKEYLIDYAEGETKTEGERVLAECLEDIPAQSRKKTMEMLARIENGERDVYV
ncbi:MAG: [FeFe] hydrogenase H-cluster radical SAM maturase HydG [Armatimonadetes bacterium]|nr:[FeFe] hydrogenase H-cluster radical SAM maturase HydG [Armatimonadota bacterium]